MLRRIAEARDRIRDALDVLRGRKVAVDKALFIVPMLDRAAMVQRIAEQIHAAAKRFCPGAPN